VISQEQVHPNEFFKIAIRTSVNADDYKRLSRRADTVRRELTNARRLESNEKFFQSLLKHYEIVVEQIDPAKADQKFAKVK
jgi:hypothetical protein